MAKLTAFTWGYWGWGTHTSDFVRAVDAIEHGRGRRPPIFADIRYSRSVRAPGFRENAFEQTVGRGRYRWIRKLGNQNIGTEKRAAKIADLSGIEDLRRLVVDAHRQKRTVILFCACELPCICHRSMVAKHLHESAARKRTPITIIEWPGGEPETVTLAVSSKVITSVLRGARRIALTEFSPRIASRLVSLPWCSRVDLRSGDTSLGVVSGPAKLATSWYLPVIDPESRMATDTARSLKANAARLRESLGYAAIS